MFGHDLIYELKLFTLIRDKAHSQCWQVETWENVLEIGKLHAGDFHSSLSWVCWCWGEMNVAVWIISLMFLFNYDTINTLGVLETDKQINTYSPHSNTLHTKQHLVKTLPAVAENNSGEFLCGFVSKIKNKTELKAPETLFNEALETQLKTICIWTVLYESKLLTEQCIKTTPATICSYSSERAPERSEDMREWRHLERIWD